MNPYAAFTLNPVPLTPEAFAPFGEVVAHQGTDRRHVIHAATRTVGAAVLPRLWVSRIQAAASRPLVVTYLERHQRSSQTFIPLTSTASLIVVAPGLPDGRPDVPNMKAFVASGEQGVCYAPGVWHHGLSPLEAPAQFVVTMGLADDGQDDEFLTLPAPVTVVWDRP